MSKRLRIGIMEYEDDLLELLAYSLENAGFEPVLFATERKMWKHILRRRLDILIVGNLAPDTDPQKFGKKVKKKLGEDLPVMIRLSTDSTENKKKGKNLFSGTIVVPETPRKIVKSIHKIWEKASKKVA